jgi:hypothetical protein
MESNNLFEQKMNHQYYFNKILYEIQLLGFNKLLKEMIRKIDIMNSYLKDIEAPKNIYDYVYLKEIFVNITSEINDIKDILNTIKENFNNFNTDDFLNHVENKVSKIYAKVIGHRLYMVLYGSVLLIKECHNPTISNKQEFLETPVEPVNILVNS